MFFIYDSVVKVLAEANERRNMTELLSFLGTL